MKIEQMSIRNILTPWHFEEPRASTVLSTQNQKLYALPAYQIPSSFANLRNLATVRFQGNSFEGPIPSSFSNLTSLKELELRNNKISGSIPSILTTTGVCKIVRDLSFNNISGTIPRSLFRSFMLTHPFLGNNRLSGTPPTYKSGKLLNINLVANNFTLESNNSILLFPRFLPYGLKCLQRSFPCNRGSPIYSSFAIKCGGPQITSNNILYEMDDEILGPATYYVTETNRWGINFKPTVRPPSGPSPTTKKNLIVGIIVGVGVVSLLLLAVFFIVQRRRQQTNDDGKSIDLCYR
ncbi:hypothetical protein Pint_21512 [Pistacia integerrima]|uniref:Uncharacterized protein n=1 Tax=Pistacia integerrima TaxID=434235 RepID=A0ACC0XC61_9ROSI|nr:hypothetical protein Pint_21512 [Pistacia integerrima]